MGSDTPCLLAAAAVWLKSVEAELRDDSLLGEGLRLGGCKGTMRGERRIETVQSVGHSLLSGYQKNKGRGVLMGQKSGRIFVPIFWQMFY